MLDEVIDNIPEPGAAGARQTPWAGIQALQHVELLRGPRSRWGGYHRGRPLPPR
jgi:hypothetical protein